MYIDIKSCMYVCMCEVKVAATLGGQCGEEGKEED